MQTSLKLLGNVLKQEGTSREDRYLPALHETGRLLDDRKLQDFILYMQEYSKNLLFVDVNNPRINYKESWEDFFANDPVLLIAHIASADIQKSKEEYDRLQMIFQRRQSIDNFARVAGYVLSRFVLVNKWYILSPENSLLQQDLNLYIRSYLQREMENLREVLLYCFDHLEDDINGDKKDAINMISDRVKNDLKGMVPIWKMDQKEKIALREKIFSGANETEKLSNAGVIVNKAFETIFHATETIAQKSGKYFDETILNKQDHNPHVALVITFIKLFGYQQAALNKVPQRLLGFYYRDVLKIRAKEPEPDLAYVIFELTKGFNSCLLKKGTRLSAGKDKHNYKLTYETDKDVVLNTARVQDLRTSFIDRKLTGEILNYYTGAVNKTPGKVAVEPAEASLIAPMFGQVSAEPAAFGFAIASSQLYLAKGDRNVVVNLYGAQALNPGSAPGPAEDYDPTIISVQLTGEKEWIDSDAEDSNIRVKSLKLLEGSTLELNFSISIAQAQAVIAYDRKLHGGSFETDLPLVRVLLRFPEQADAPANADEQIRQLNALQRFEVAGGNIRVSVGSINQQKVSFDGVRDLLLENDDAPLDSSKPFFPFTPIPRVSGSFYVGCTDLFYKNIEDLSLNIEWLLPDNFAAHYKKYNPPYDTNKFVATLSYLYRNHWVKYADVSLITVGSPDPRFRILKMSLDKLRNELAAVPDEGVSTYDSVKKNGTIKLKLRYPDFGHSVYPQLITSLVMEQANKSANVDFYKLVKRKLHDDVFTIVLPGDFNDPDGSVKVIYNILKLKADEQARTMLVNALSDIISRMNGIARPSRKAGQVVDASDEKESTQIVHDQNFLEKILRFFRKLHIVKNDVHHDRDEQTLDTQVEHLEDDISKVADFILPSRRELINLITSEVNKIIYQSVGIAVDATLEARAENNNSVDPDTVDRIFRETFDKANEVINDMIAKKIAVFLTTNEIPPPPYAPLVNNISLNYASSKKLSRADGDKLFHLTPVGGIVETGIWGAAANTPSTAFVRNTVTGLLEELPETVGEEKAVYDTRNLLPQPLAATVGEPTATTIQGMLYIGVKDLLPGANLSLLFQVAEGSRNNDQAPPLVSWYYLRANVWRKFRKEQIISDSTHALQGTGIIEFAIPADAAQENHMFDVSGLSWLCAAVPGGADAFPFLVDVKSQAAQVRFVDFRNNVQHLALPLPAGKIKMIIDDVPEVKQVTQPVASFGGKVGEKENEYFIRVSERLRHKSRAISNWDYESLVLEKFPSLFKVKCLNNYYDGHFAVGHVTIVPIPDLRNRNYAGSNLLVPRINYVNLKMIEDYLLSISTPFLKTSAGNSRIHAVNPKLEHVLVSCRVKFYTGVDNGYFLRQLNDDLVNYLTPWATDMEKNLFSGKIYASSIINFIDDRPYVDFVQNLEMFQYTENEKGEKTSTADANQVQALVETQLTTGHSILVSAPKHSIELVE